MARLLFSEPDELIEKTNNGCDLGLENVQNATVAECIIQGLGAGTIFFVTFCELLPGELSAKHLKVTRAVIVVIGFFVMDGRRESSDFEAENSFFQELAQRALSSQVVAVAARRGVSLITRLRRLRDQAGSFRNSHR